MAVKQNLWRVVGGEGSGGILVREGKDLKSAACSERLSTGAKVTELETDGGRLKYELVDGTGPKIGWISLKLKGAELMTRIEEHGDDQDDAHDEAEGDVAISGELPRQLRPACEMIAAGLKAVEILKPFVPVAGVKAAKEKAKLRLNGDMYGLPLPVTPEEFESEDFSAAWLTKAFHAAGTLPDDNRVVRIVSAQNFPGGGSGPKTLFMLEYQISDDSLDSTLFMKLPAQVGVTGSGVSMAQQRTLDMQGMFGDIWGAEIQFYRFVTPFIPFAVPKYYFGDLSRESQQAVIITTAVEWPDKMKKRFGPYQVLPPCEKCEDYTLSDSKTYYFALLKHLGTLAGLQKVGKLGKEIDKIQWSPSFPDSRGVPADAVAHFKTFVQEVSPQIWPSKVKSAGFFDFLEKYGSTLQKHAATISAYFYSNPLYVGFGHQNGNTDNAYFFRNAEGVMDCGLFDWGSAGYYPYATELQGAFGSCLGEVFAENDDRFMHIFADAYHATGAPAMDVDELILHLRLSTSVNCFGLFMQVIPWLSEKHPQGRPFWKQVTAYNDDKIRKVFALKFGLSMLYNKMLILSLRGDVYSQSMNQWVKRTQES